MQRSLFRNFLRCGYAVLRGKYAPGYDLLATKGKEALYVQVKTLTENRGQVRLSYKELQMMLRESEFGDSRGFLGLPDFCFEPSSG